MADIYEGGVPAALAVGHVAEARRVAERLDSHAERLSTHHRLHGVAVRLEVEEIAADWEQIRALTARAEEAVAANFETPCLRNARSLLLCATAWEDEEEVERAAELERRADELGMEGYDDVLNAARLRLELARGRLDRVEQLVAASARGGWLFSFGAGTLTARLDALLALRDRERLESKAPPYVEAGGLIAPFAARALGAVREDEELVRSALRQFEALGLGRHAEQTRSLLQA